MLTSMSIDTNEEARRTSSRMRCWPTKGMNTGNDIADMKSRKIQGGTILGTMNTPLPESGGADRDK